MNRKWISVKKKLPKTEDCERVLIKLQSGDIEIAQWIDSTGMSTYNSWHTDKGWWYGKTDVSGWLPLSELRENKVDKVMDFIRAIIVLAAAIALVISAI